MDMPVRSYSSGMRARLAFGMSMGIAFDWYLVDEITAVGDAASRRSRWRSSSTGCKDAGLLMVSHSPNTIRTYCTSGLVLERGEATYFDDVEEAIAAHERNMAEGAERSTLGAEGSDTTRAEVVGTYELKVDLEFASAAYTQALAADRRPDPGPAAPGSVISRPTSPRGEFCGPAKRRRAAARAIGIGPVVVPFEVGNRAGPGATSFVHPDASRTRINVGN